MNVKETTYLDGEGRPQIAECIQRAFRWCVEHSTQKLVIFTGTGEGAVFAVERLLPGNPSIKLVAVTPPVGKQFRENPAEPSSRIVASGPSPVLRDFLRSFGVQVISAHLPFKPLEQSRSEWTIVEKAFGVLGGGFALCVQAALVACDAGELVVGERAVVASADTAIEIRAARTETFLSATEGLLVEHIICRPNKYSISKARHLAYEHPPVPSGTRTPAGLKAPGSQVAPRAIRGGPKE
jgi:hypothetical protein